MTWLPIYVGLWRIEILIYVSLQAAIEKAGTDGSGMKLIDREIGLGGFDEMGDEQETF